MDLTDVYESIGSDPFWAHLRKPGIHLVPGFGASKPKVMLVGEAPGATENARLRPFCGASGRALDGLLELAGLRLQDEPPGDDGQYPGMDLGQSLRVNAFITNVVKYRPPQNRTPTDAEIYHAREGFRQRSGPIGNRVIDESMPEGAGSLREEWRALGKPRLIVCIGGVAHRALHPSGHEGISKHAGREPVVVVGGVKFSSQYHPAYALRKGLKVQAECERHWELLGDFIRREGILDAD